MTGATSGPGKKQIYIKWKRFIVIEKWIFRSDQPVRDDDHTFFVVAMTSI
jgi:hypothetical protein